MPVISIQAKNATGSLSRRDKSFTFGGGGGLTLMDVTVNWQPDQTSGPVGFSFTLVEPIGRFPAGKYVFAGNIASDKTPCGAGAIACGGVKWPGPQPHDPVDEPGWEATGGPVEENEDAEEPAADECAAGPSADDDADEPSADEDAEEPAADTEKPYNN